MGSDGMHLKVLRKLVGVIVSLYSASSSWQQIEESSFSVFNNGKWRVWHLGITMCNYRVGINGLKVALQERSWGS